MAAFQTAACNIKHRLQGQKIHEQMIKWYSKESQVYSAKAVIFELYQYFMNIVRYVSLKFSWVQ